MEHEKLRLALGRPAVAIDVRRSEHPEWIGWLSTRPFGVRYGAPFL